MSTLTTPPDAPWSLVLTAAAIIGLAVIVAGLAVGGRR